LPNDRAVIRLDFKGSGVLDDFHRRMKARSKRERTSFRPVVSRGPRNGARRKPRPRGWFRTGQVLGRRARGDTALTRGRRGGTLPPVATSCLSDPGLCPCGNVLVLKERPQRRGNSPVREKNVHDNASRARTRERTSTGRSGVIVRQRSRGRRT
jgi:hypothetical protein